MNGEGEDQRITSIYQLRNISMIIISKIKHDFPEVKHCYNYFTSFYTGTHVFILMAPPCSSLDLQLHRKN